jgi:predicted nucleic acid-binding protein
MPTPRSIFVNSSGWLALYNPNDPNHDAAVAVWNDLREQNVRFVVTDYVLDQVYTALKVFGSLQAAQALNVVLSNSSLVRFFMADSVIFDRAWKVFTDDDHPEWTFTDCINYAVIQYLGLSEVITFDPTFTAPGLAILPYSGR